ncbi:MAG: DNA repair protein RecO, partial [Bacteroidetes bacterium]|nr:DNA repair protein RecO [Bacteroidota bacterium]
MITKTEAVVLRSVDYSESSLIVTLFTRKHGITAVIAKGAKR